MQRDQSTKSSTEEPTSKNERTPSSTAIAATGSRSPTLRDKFQARLLGSRFRMLNEDLYTTTSSTAFQRFSEHPELYDQYHAGFRHQVEQWPVNPIDVLVQSITKSHQHAKDGKGEIIVADFGCGDAELAKQLLQVKQKGHFPFCFTCSSCYK